MKAAVLHAPGDLRDRIWFTRPETPAAGEVLVRVRAAGICGSDLDRATHKTGTYKFPTIPGHEFCGVVAEVGRKGRKFQSQ